MYQWRPLFGWFDDSYWSWLFIAAVTIVVFVVAEADIAAAAVVAECLSFCVPLLLLQQLVLSLLRLLFTCC
jgi:hypothetical protein